MYVLGINAFHGDSSACLLYNGRMVAAAEEERFRRIKHWAGFPSEAIKYCLSHAKIGPSELAHIALNRDPKANLLKKIGFALAKRPDFSLMMDRLKNQRDWSSLESNFNETFPEAVVKAKFHYVEHHLAHLASSYYASDFREALAISIDGFGDFASAAWGMGEGSKLEVDERIYFPHSLGVFYQSITQYLGFQHYGDEYKVMGLAPYGNPSQISKMREILKLHSDGSFSLNLTYFRHHREKVDYEWNGGVPSVGRLYSDELESLLGKSRAPDEKISQYHMDIASSAQLMYEEAFLNLINKLYSKYGSKNLALAGGCAMNSVANGKILTKSPYTGVYIPPAAGDAGGAVGAAMAVWYTVSKTRTSEMKHAAWGPEYADVDIQQLLNEFKSEIEGESCSVVQMQDEADLCRRTAEAISKGKVIGWFSGRMEWGPRALGNRSILGDPRRDDMKDILNLKIKRRESFRPFAPSILRESVADWFEIDTDVPFMMQVHQIKPERRPLIPAVTHVDGSGRLQTVTKEDNGRYYLLIKEFQRITGIPLLVNTSFNENEPVVCRPVEALNCFLRTKMDVLVLGNHYLERQT